MLRFCRAAALLVLPLALADARADERDPSQVQVESRIVHVEETFLEKIGIQFDLGGTSQEVSKLSQGTVILPDGEVPLAELDGSVFSTRVGGSLSYDLSEQWGKRWGADGMSTRFSFAYTTGDASVSREIQPGGEDVAITWEAPSGATGVNLLDTGLFAVQQIDADALDLRFTKNLSYDACDTSDITLTPGLSLVYASREQDASGSAISILDPDINSQTRQILTDRYYGLGVALGVDYRITERFGLYGNTGMDLLYNDTKYRSTQWNRCGNVGCNPLDAEFEVNLRDDTGGFALGGHLEAGASYRWNGLEARAGLGLDYLSRRAEARVPATPPGGDFDYLSTRNAIEPRFQFGVSYAF